MVRLKISMIVIRAGLATHPVTTILHKSGVQDGLIPVVRFYVHRYQPVIAASIQMQSGYARNSWHCRTMMRSAMISSESCLRIEFG